ncbi:MAG: hypothetical protein C4289_04130 [Chloroflexota bacterium]
MYVMLAWSLRHGLGYVHEVGSRAIPHTVWPPGFPAMLAGVLLARPESTVVSAQALQMLKLVPVLAYAYSILLAWVWVRSIGGSALAAIGVAALAPPRGHRLLPTAACRASVHRAFFGRAHRRRAPPPAGQVWDRIPQ